MNSVTEKEKKLNLALTKLKNLNLKNPQVKNHIENLNIQKNQLEIEKKELEAKYKTLSDEYENLSKKLDEFENQEIFRSLIHVYAKNWESDSYETLIFDEMRTLKTSLTKLQRLCRAQSAAEILKTI